MKRHIQNTRTRLGELASLAAKTEADERRILSSATRRLGEVIAMIERQRPGLELASDAAQDRYVDLVKERGQLEMVISKAKHALGG